jgi:hypothetical protein
MQGKSPFEVVVLHVDDHDDLMSPRIWQHEDIWIDAITKNEIDLLRSDTIYTAIKSGSIGIGSFIVPLLHHIPKVHIRHLCSTEYSVSRKGRYLLQRSTVPDDLLNLHMNRLATKLIPEVDQKFYPDSTYSVAASLDEWLTDLPDAPILLHIDLDYFNNRFNGDSDWELHACRHDPPEQKVLGSIDAMFNALADWQIFNRIEDIAVAISPGFFPAEFWSLAIDRIHYNIGKLDPGLMV